ncbi:MAG: stage VI sporulation protein F [Tenericutes bacterium]|nr:stage VI sporulation protein F [Mycoplasmatota bacterium]
MGKEDLFDKIEKKTKVGKDTILKLARELQDGDFKNENTLRNIISEISEITGKEVSKEKEDKIVNMVINDKVPKDIDKYV